MRGAERGATRTSTFFTDPYSAAEITRRRSAYWLVTRSRARLEPASSVSVPSCSRLTRRGLIQLRHAASPISCRMRLVTRSQASAGSTSGRLAWSGWSGECRSGECRPGECRDGECPWGCASVKWVVSLPDMQLASGCLMWCASGVFCNGRRLSDLGKTLLADNRSAQDGGRAEWPNKPAMDADISIDSLGAGIDPICREIEKIQCPNRLRVIRRLNNAIQMRSGRLHRHPQSQPPMSVPAHEKTRPKPNGPCDVCDSPATAPARHRRFW